MSRSTRSAEQTDASDPDLPTGIVEGFYGDQWTHDERLAAIDFLASTGGRLYLYAPKSDPFHRDRWREPYPPEAAARLGLLADRARSVGVRFVYGLSPGLDMRYSDDGEHRALVAKASSLIACGVQDLSLIHI